MRTVLVTGGAGYIGTVLISRLLRSGYAVRCVDRCFFGEDKLASFHAYDGFDLIKADVRFLDGALFEGVDTVVDMAALSNDPAGNIDARLTWEINKDARLRVARLAKAAGVKTYLLTSSCSVYGFSEDLVNEESPTNPLTTYARATLAAEECLELEDATFKPLVLRLATVFGISPRMRFDLAVNVMTMAASKRGSIDVLGQGMQWRPFIHVEDVADGINRILDRRDGEIKHSILNFGSNENNLKVITLAFMIREHLPFNVRVNVVNDDIDNRSYRVDFGRLEEALGWKPTRSIAYGIKEVYEAYRSGEVTDSLETVTSEWYRYLLNAERCIKNLHIEGRLF